MRFAWQVVPALLLLAGSGAAHADERILRYFSDVQVQPDSSLDVTETIDLRAEHDRINHGIYRDFPIRYRGPHGAQMRVGFTFEGATLDGKPVPASTETIANGVRIKIGDPDSYVDIGEHSYVLRYRTTRQVGRFALRGDRTMFLFIFRAPVHAPIGDDLASRKAVLHREFDDAGWECPRILAAVDASDDLYFDVVSQVRLPRWSQGRVALVGDAAACVSLLAGEGTGLAMTEAYVLAGELAHAGGIPPDASPELLASGIDFVLEGLYALKKISRSDERGYHGAEAPVRRAPREAAFADEAPMPKMPAGKKKYYN